MTTKYAGEIADAQKSIAEAGIKVTYGFLEPEYGQQTTEDTRIETVTEVDVFFRTGFYRRQGDSFMPRNQLTALMASVNFTPKIGDYLITPKGKRYPIDEVTVIAPDGEPILYYLRLTDG